MGLIVDLFAGGGGASEGIRAAIGRDPDVAINHSRQAVAMHRANHPTTRHYVEDVWKVAPREATRGRAVDLLWASPDCTHFSRAKGTKPVKKSIRGLAWSVVRWAREASPRVICLENVGEFQTWGPLDENDRPDKARAGLTFRRWLGQLRALGYEVDFRELTAADYGTPTTRRRLFLVARRDGDPIGWAPATHGTTTQPWRPAADVIDWSLPVRSIFGRSKPLAEATLARIAKGLRRFVLDAGSPGPFIVRHGHYSTITGAGLREGCGAGTFRGQSLTAPLGTVCATNDKHLVCPIVTKHYGGVTGHRIDRPLGTVTARDHHALTVAFLTKFYGTAVGSDLRNPLPTVAGGGQHLAEVRALLAKHAPALPLVSLLDGDAVVRIHGEPYAIVDVGMRMLAPRELFRAQGFRDDYVIDLECDGKALTQEEQTRLAGNSVCPQVAEAVVRAQLGRAEARAA